MTVDTHEPTVPQGRPDWLWHTGVLGFFAVWYVVYGQLIPFSEWVTSLLPVDRNSHTGEAIAFFFYDVPKVMMLLTHIVFAGVVASGILAVGFLFNLTF